MTDLTPVEPAKPPSLVVTVFSMFARHVVNALVGIGISAGAVQEDQRTQAAAIGLSILVWLLNLAWSWWEKSRHAKTSETMVVQARAAGVVQQAVATGTQPAVPY